jgi:hypothetical protein
MSSTASVQRRFSLLLILGALACLSVISFACNAYANEFAGRLAAKSWTSDGIVAPLYFEYAEEYASNLSICVGPVQHTGSGYVFPYGWKCGRIASWEFPTITASAGIDNPNSQEAHYRAISSH